MTPETLPLPDKADPGPGLARLVAAGPVVRMRVPVVGTMTFLTTRAACEAMLAELAVVLRLLFARHPGVALAVPEAELHWTGQAGIRALRHLPLTRPPRAGM